VNAGALHHDYSAKKELGLAVVRERVARAVDEAWIKPMVEPPRAAEGIRSAFLAIANELERQGMVRGCPLTNLAIELAFADPDCRAFANGRVARTSRRPTTWRR
jgi:AcrR family transcriptional regulator